MSIWGKECFVEFLIEAMAVRVNLALWIIILCVGYSGCHKFMIIDKVFDQHKVARELQQDISQKSTIKD